MPAPTNFHRRSVHRFAKFYGVDLKRVPPKSRPAACAEAAIYLRRWNPARARLARTPPSTFLFLPIHLSNSPGLATPLPRRARELAKQLPPTRVDDKSPKSEELRRRAIPPSGGAPCVGYICSAAGYCQPCILEFFIRSSSVAAGAFTAVSGTGLLFAIADL